MPRETPHAKAKRLILEAIDDSPDKYIPRRVARAILHHNGMTKDYHLSNVIRELKLFAHGGAISRTDETPQGPPRRTLGRPSSVARDAMWLDQHLGSDMATLIKEAKAEGISETRLLRAMCARPQYKYGPGDEW